MKIRLSNISGKQVVMSGVILYLLGFLFGLLMPVTEMNVPESKNMIISQLEDANISIPYGFFQKILVNKRGGRRIRFVFLNFKNDFDPGSR